MASANWGNSRTVIYKGGLLTEAGVGGPKREHTTPGPAQVGQLPLPGLEGGGGQVTSKLYEESPRGGLTPRAMTFGQVTQTVQILEGGGGSIF